MSERSDSERIAIIETIVKNLEHRLLGNGKPGEVETLHSRLNAHGKRIADLEHWRWWLLGIGLGIGLGSGAGIMKIIEAATK
jgi:hypothetical protein